MVSNVELMDFSGNIIAPNFNSGSQIEVFMSNFYFLLSVNQPAIVSIWKCDGLVEFFCQFDTS